MFAIGQKVVCIDGSPPQYGAAQLPLRLIEGAIYTIRSIHTEQHIDGYGVRLEELVNPSIVWSDGDDCEWSYNSARFRHVADVLESTINSSTETV